MKRTTRCLAIASAGAFLFLGGCASDDERRPYDYDQEPTTYDWELDEQVTAPGAEDPGQVATTDEWLDEDVGQQPDGAQPQSVAVTTIRPTQGNDAFGEIRFEGMQDGDVNMIADLQNLQPNTEYVILLGGQAAPGEQQPAHQDAEVLGFVLADEMGQGYVERTVEILGVGDDVQEPISDHVLFVSPIERTDEEEGTLPAGAPREGAPMGDRSRIGEPVGMGQTEQY